VVNAPTRRVRPLSARVAAVADVDRADLVALVLALVELLEIRARWWAIETHDVCGSSRELVAVAGPQVLRDLPGGAGLADMADELAPEALATLAEVLRAVVTVR